MLRLRQLILLFIGISTAVQAFGANAADDSMVQRADRFFKYREWASAEALYSVLIGETPDNTLFYGRAITSAGMLADSTQQLTLTNLALEAHVPIDSLFTSVERTSFSIGQTSLYEDYLLLTKAKNPWLKRVVDSYLMRYYTYRRNPDGMIEYSKIMLEGNADDQRFLNTLAQGYLISGRIDEAIDTYRHIVALNPQAYEALLYLANYYYERAAADPTAVALAADYFRRAQAINPTPYVQQRIFECASKE